MNAVSFAESSSRGSCQNPEVAASLLKTFAPDSLYSISSSVGITYLSLLMFPFKRLKSVQILISPFLFMTGTIPAHQSVASVISSIMLFAFMRSISALTLSISGIGTLLAVYKLYGSAPFFSFIFNGLHCNGLQSKSPKTDGVLCISLVFCTLYTRLRSLASLRLERFSVSASTTKRRKAYWQSFSCLTCVANWPWHFITPPGDFKTARVLFSVGFGTSLLYWLSEIMDISAPVSILNWHFCPLITTDVNQGFLFSSTESKSLRFQFLHFLNFLCLENFLQLRAFDVFLGSMQRSDFFFHSCDKSFLLLDIQSVDYVSLCHICHILDVDWFHVAFEHPFGSIFCHDLSLMSLHWRLEFAVLTWTLTCSCCLATSIAVFNVRPGCSWSFSDNSLSLRPTTSLSRIVDSLSRKSACSASLYNERMYVSIFSPASWDRWWKTALSWITLTFGVKYPLNKSINSSNVVSTSTSNVLKICSAFGPIL